MTFYKLYMAGLVLAALVWFLAGLRPDRRAAEIRVTRRRRPGR